MCQRNLKKKQSLSVLTLLIFVAYECKYVPKPGVQTLYLASCLNVERNVRLAVELLYDSKNEISVTRSGFWTALLDISVSYIHFLHIEERSE